MGLARSMGLYYALKEAAKNEKGESDEG